MGSLAAARAKAAESGESGAAMAANRSNRCAYPGSARSRLRTMLTVSRSGGGEPAFSLMPLLSRCGSGRTRNGSLLGKREDADWGSTDGVIDSITKSRASTAADPSSCADTSRSTSTSPLLSAAPTDES